MRNFIKKILLSSPLFLRKFLLWVNETYFALQSKYKERKEYPALSDKAQKDTAIKNILIYHISGLTFGGTEKNLQLIANGLSDTYNIFFMCALKDEENSRRGFLKPAVTLIPFTYSSKEQKFPYFIHGMSPHVKDILATYNIDLFISADSGHSQYPFNTIKNIPILFINIFGSPAIQKNIVSTVFISPTVQRHAEVYTGNKKGNTSLCIPVVPPSEKIQQEMPSLRKKLGLLDSDFVFGRIGRNADSIFDPIGIRAFQKIVKEFPSAHYLIMSPPPILEKIVQDEHIPNVHFLPPSGDENNIWAFHYAIDCLAHFRLDGETFGLNIAESMFAGNPIITHASHIWNAHIEYLSSSSFARIAEQNNVEQYASFMKEYILLKKDNPTAWQEMRYKSHQYAQEHFMEKEYIETIKNIIRKIGN